MDSDAFIALVKEFMAKANDAATKLTQRTIDDGRLPGVAAVPRHRSALAALGDRVLVSVVVPTTPGRRWAHRSVYECFRGQTWPSRELVVLETGGDGAASAFWRNAARNDGRVRYVYEAQDMNLGPKRNRFLEFVRGAVVAQFDDDDLYAPRYLDTMVAALLEPCLDDLDCVDDVALRGLLGAPRIAMFAAAWIATAGSGGPRETSELSISVTSTSIRLIFGRIDGSRRVLEAQPKRSRRNCRVCSH